MIYTRDEAIQYLDQLGENKTPFVFFTDFLAKKAWIKPIDEIDPNELRYQFSDQQNPVPGVDFKFKKFPLSFQDFRVSYDQVLHELTIGNSYLVNLTFKTQIELSLSLGAAASGGGCRAARSVQGGSLRGIAHQPKPNR